MTLTLREDSRKLKEAPQTQRMRDQGSSQTSAKTSRNDTPSAGSAFACFCEHSGCRFGNGCLGDRGLQGSDPTARIADEDEHGSGDGLMAC